MLDELNCVYEPFGECVAARRMRAHLKFVRFSVPIIIGSCCWSCSTDFDVVPSGVGPNIQLQFVQNGWSKGDGRQCVSEVTVAEEEWPTRGAGPVVWQIEAIHGCTPLSSVDLGHVPDGFVKLVDRLPLKKGRMYGASAHGRSVHGAYLPWFVCREGPAIIDWKNENHLSSPPAGCAPE